MYGGAFKLGGGGRGGGGGGRNNPAAMKRAPNSLPPQHPHRPASRLSLGGTPPSNPRNRSSTGTSGSVTAGGVEENFSLVPGNNPLAFAMMIRLAPDLVDEIKRVEAQGGTPKIKFDSMGTNPSGNVIDVGGKEFRFTWAREFGDLCDVYEERQSGEDGNGLLVESGSAWRKVNVQRVLDESTKNHVKMRSEEAERKLKSRKAIVLDNANPAAKSQIKQLAAVESNPWRNFKQKKEPPIKKRKVDPPPAASISKSVSKPGLASTPATKGRRSSSPLSSPPEQSGASASPFGTGNNAKSHISTEVSTPILMKNKDNAASARSEKEIPRSAPAAAPVLETTRQKGNLGAAPMDLQNLLITLLTKNPKGMTLKALEKAVGDAIPNSAKKIEPIMKRIALCQTQGRYFLKPAMELESFKGLSSETGSSPEDNCQQILPPKDNHDQRHTPDAGATKKNPAVGLEESQPNLTHEESSPLAKIHIQQPSPDVFGEKKISDNSEGQAGSSSDSGSDSDSESDTSDSGSDSGSRSRSKSRSSPVGSGSGGSSSDSESDASSNSKEGSDVEVDIMTSDDDKEVQHKEPSELGQSVSPDPWGFFRNETDVKQQCDGPDAVVVEGHGSAAVDIEGHEAAAVDIEGHESDAVDISKDFVNDENETETAVDDSLVPRTEGEMRAERAKSYGLDHDNFQERESFIGNLFDDNENIGNGFGHEQSDSTERIPLGKSKRGSDVKQFDEKLERAKRSKGASVSPHSRCIEDSFKGPAAEVMDRADSEGNTDFHTQRAYDQVLAGKSSSDFQQSERRSSDHSTWSKAPDMMGRSKRAESSGQGLKFPEKGSHVHEGFPIPREKASRDGQNEDTFAKKEKKAPRNPKEGGARGRRPAPLDPVYKEGEISGKFKDAAQVTNPQVRSSPKDNIGVDTDNYPVVSGRVLQRELSDLELGELREPLPGEIPIKKQFERKDSFKQSEKKPSSSGSGHFNSDLGKGKPVGKVTSDAGKPFPNLSSVVKKTPEDHVEDLTRSHQVVQSHSHHISRVDNADVASQTKKLSDANSRSRQAETGTKLANGTEGYGESVKKAPTSTQQFHDPKSGLLSHPVKESKTKASNIMADLVDGQKDTVLTEVNNNAPKRKESSLEEDITYLSKYEKDVPELKGPIKDFSQYKEYVQEFRDKYDSYCSLNKILESYRNDFQKLEKDLELAKGRDMDRYHKILVQLKESYHHCGARHKRLKKIFVILHKELENLKQKIKDFAGSYQKD